MILKQTADDLVRMTSELVGGRTINIMDTSGVIIASTEGDRVGTVHEGALEVVKGGKPVFITKEQTGFYMGAKEGCNMPIIENGNIIGVVGIYGNPDEIGELSHLLQVYASKYFELEEIISQRIAEDVSRSRLLRTLCSYNEANHTYVQSLIEYLQVSLVFPLRFIIISFPPEALTGNAGKKIVDRLLQKGLIANDSDLYSVEDARIFILKSRCTNDMHTFWSDISDALGFIGNCRICAGSLSTDLKSIRRSYEEACGLNEFGSRSINDICKTNVRCEYLMGCSVKCGEKYLGLLYRNLSDMLGDEELETLLMSAECYYNEDKSISKAAEKLFIHKNTLQYRIHRLMEAMDLSRCPKFYQEYLVRLILQYRRTASE